MIVVVMSEYYPLKGSLREADLGEALRNDWSGTKLACINKGRPISVSP